MPEGFAGCYQLLEITSFYDSDVCQPSHAISNIKTGNNNEFFTLQGNEPVCWVNGALHVLSMFFRGI